MTLTKKYGFDIIYHVNQNTTKRKEKTMTQYEIDVAQTLIRNVPDISKNLKTIVAELKKANELKAIELKAAHPEFVDMVDSVLAN